MEELNQGERVAEKGRERDREKGREGKKKRKKNAGMGAGAFKESRNACILPGFKI